VGIAALELAWNMSGPGWFSSFRAGDAGALEKKLGSGRDEGAGEA